MMGNYRRLTWQQLQNEQRKYSENNGIIGVIGNELKVTRKLQSYKFIKLVEN